MEAREACPPAAARTAACRAGRAAVARARAGPVAAPAPGGTVRRAGAARRVRVARREPRAQAARPEQAALAASRGPRAEAARPEQAARAAWRLRFSGQRRRGRSKRRKRRWRQGGVRGHRRRGRSKRRWWQGGVRGRGRRGGSRGRGRHGGGVHVRPGHGFHERRPAVPLFGDVRRRSARAHLDAAGAHRRRNRLHDRRRAGDDRGRQQRAGGLDPAPAPRARARAPAVGGRRLVGRRRGCARRVGRDAQARARAHRRRDADLDGRPPRSRQRLRRRRRLDRAGRHQRRARRRHRRQAGDGQDRRRDGNLDADPAELRSGDLEPRRRLDDAAGQGNPNLTRSPSPPSPPADSRPPCSRPARCSTWGAPSIGSFNGYAFGTQATEVAAALQGTMSLVFSATGDPCIALISRCRPRTLGLLPPTAATQSRAGSPIPAATTWPSPARPAHRRQRRRQDGPDHLGPLECRPAERPRDRGPEQRNGDRSPTLRRGPQSQHERRRDGRRGERRRRLGQRWRLRDHGRHLAFRFFVATSAWE